MPFIETADASGSEQTAAMYAQAEALYGYLPNMVKAFGHRPEVMERWSALLASIKSNMDLRRYELVTMAAAKELKSSYCMLAHGSVLMRDIFTADEMREVAEDTSEAPITDAERAIMQFAAKVVRDATSIEKLDVDILKKHGLSDAEIFDVVTAAAVRCFFSKTLDALGAQADSAYDTLAPGLKAALVVGRPIDDTAQV
ncbi:carboxymuconolactone decarboxylase family protein [Pararhizobium sp. BT-229]|uniref:carboxymuconolactone decarboxylase family protein n=1 Tax=Pararhizobium sp. BT-229 TaxID=2986923 RepID=UPI0021F74C61|nr:carboxymuconolactone decarboxylase family protein [Pararhizobium sp. BT-229]MCV9960485.1 carboxymuconolactone decarboxylase family protein [Pararhizobium sp. BT-229]